MLPDDLPGYTGFLFSLFIVTLAIRFLFLGTFPKKYRIALLLVILLAGFLLMAPMTPVMFMVLAYRLTGSSTPFVTAFAGIILVIVITMIFGRVFCGYGCPVGAIQELPYYLPLKKFVFHQNSLLLLLRGVLITFLCLVAFFFAIKLLYSSLILLKGAMDIFSVAEITLPILLFFVIILLSVFLYRPFCRFACPLGALLSLASWKSRYRMKMTKDVRDRDVVCRSCPTGEMTEGRQGNECYLCGRCMDAISDGREVTYARR